VRFSRQAGLSVAVAVGMDDWKHATSGRCRC